ncbi:MAG: SpoIIIAH-like family protein [Clostridiales bacterium]|nr:SpoIIIAH-like family protein [Clostridiales bacterium]
MKSSNVKRKKFVIFSLVLMLGLIGYVNYNLNKQSFLQTSSELEKYRMTMLEESGILLDNEEEEVFKEENYQNEDMVEEVVEENIDIGEVIDSRDYNEIRDLAQETNAQITENITNKLMDNDMYFIANKLERDKKRSEMVSQLNDIIDNELTTNDIRDQAQALKLEMISNTEKEILIENMLMAKGFTNAIVYITDDSINVVVNSDVLKDKDVAQIVDIIRRETDILMDNITIMNKK